jgi:hypothetical protein
MQLPCMFPVCNRAEVSARNSRMWVGCVRKVRLAALCANLYNFVFHLERGLSAALNPL